MKKEEPFQVGVEIPLNVNNSEEAMLLLQKFGYDIKGVIGNDSFYCHIENRYDCYSWEDESKFLQEFRQWMV